MIKLAIVGCGGMGHTHAKAFSAIKDCKLTAAYDVIPERAEAFSREFNIPYVYSDLDEMLAKCELDAVTLVTPDATHAPLSLKIIAKGKHILSEKPPATCYADAQAMADAAGQAGVINMINFSYRDSAAIQRAHQIIQEGKLGRIMHVEASYLQCWLSSKVWGDWRKSPSFLWRLSTRHGSGGVLGDIGVHILDFTTFAAGDIRSIDCQLRTFHKATDDRLGEYTLDANDSAVMMVEMEGGALGVIHTSRWATGHKNSLRLRVYCEKGALVVDLDKSWDTLEICRGSDVNKAEWKTLRCPKTPRIYQRFISSILSGQNDQPDYRRGAQVQKMLDVCFASDKAGKRLAV
ncbi:MAG: Gfo/Idh/MocA family oxidoreductase [Anaerolineaceae bacterium]|jgi:predicted dehydrogenase